MKQSALLTSVSAMALATGGFAPAFAEETAVEGHTGNYTLAFEGTFGHLDNAPADKWGQTSNIDDKFGTDQDLGYMGAISLTRRVTDTRDLSFGLTFGGSMDNERVFTSGGSIPGPFSGGDFISALTNDLSFGAMDVEMGLSKPLGTGTVRVFGGLRGLGLKSESNLAADKTGWNSGGSGDPQQAYLNFDAEMSSSFVGIGPRLGIGYSSKAKAGGFGFSAQVGAAALFGQRKDEGLYSALGHSGGSGGPDLDESSGYSETNSKTVLNLGAKLAIDYYVSEASKVSVGYQAQQFWNVDGFSDADNPDARPRLIDGFYIGFTTTF